MKQPRSQEPGYEALIIETIVFLVCNLSKEYDVTEHWPFDRSESLKCVVQSRIYGHSGVIRRLKMDVDCELDSDLLTKFNCLGTTDRDVLINELQRLLDFQLNPSGCAFFLDMTNW